MRIIVVTARRDKIEFGARIKRAPKTGVFFILRDVYPVPPHQDYNVFGGQ